MKAILGAMMIALATVGAARIMLVAGRATRDMFAGLGRLFKRKPDPTTARILAELQALRREVRK